MWLSYPLPPPQQWSWANSTKLSNFSVMSSKWFWWSFTLVELPPTPNPHPTNPRSWVGPTQPKFQFFLKCPQNDSSEVLPQLSCLTPPRGWVVPTQPNFHIFLKCPKNDFNEVSQWLSCPPPPTDLRLSQANSTKFSNFSEMSWKWFWWSFTVVELPPPSPSVELGYLNQIFKIF